MISLVDSVSVASEVVGMGAILLGGWWTYSLFVRQRTAVSRANLVQAVSTYRLSTHDLLVRVELKIENKGTTPIRPRTAMCQLYRIDPLGPEELERVKVRNEEGIADDTLDWPEIARRDLALERDDFFVEPGEVEALWVDFVQHDEIAILQAYFEVDCGKQYKDLHWSVTSICDLRTPTGAA